MVMDLTDLPIPPEITGILEKQGIRKLYPPQAEALPPALDGKNIVLAIPTASGKSLVAYIAILKRVQGHGKALYIVPLRALAREKYDDLKEFEVLGIKVGLAVGDYDSTGEELENYDILIATSEKADSLLRHRTNWLSRISIIVADEIHLINDPSRGPTLEVILALFRQMNPNSQIIALSATIKNSLELALWLNAEHFTSEWRPVELKEGVYFDGDIYFGDNTIIPLEKNGDAVPILVKDILQTKNQCLIFVNTRKSAETLAEKLGKHIIPTLNDDELSELVKVSERLRSAQMEITTMVTRLKEMIKSGGAFHHAGLANTQRKIVEENFRNGKIKVLVATPTLAAGINLPARRVIVRDLGRYDANFGYRPIPVLEVKQMFGRAGRPKYDKIGEAVAIAKGASDKTKIMERYVLGEPERIHSKLGMESALRRNILSTIASEYVYDEKSLKDFIENTFFAYQGDTWALDSLIEYVMEFLEKEGFITVFENSIEPTEIGRRVSRLYIDPLSAVRMKKALSAVEENMEYITPLSYLHSIAGCVDMFQLYLRESDYKWLDPLVEEHESEFLIKTPDYESDYETFLSEFKTAWLLYDWINERSEERITLTYNIGPGDIRNRVDTGQWLLYSLAEMARMLGHKDQMKDIIRLNNRVRYGVKEELLTLVNLSGIGRIRARNLFRYKLRTHSDLKNADIKKLSSIPTIGKFVANKIKEQVGEGYIEPSSSESEEDEVPAPDSNAGTNTLDRWNGPPSNSG